MGLDDCGFSAKSGLYDIRIDGSLCKEIHGSDLLCFFLKYGDKFCADDLTLLLRLGHTGKFFIVTFLCIDTDEIDIEGTAFSEYAFYFIAFVFSEKTVIDKYAGELLSDRFCK